MRRSLARTVSGAVAAAAAVLTLAGPANAITPPVQPIRLHTTLSIVESRNVIAAGHQDVISGRLTVRGTGLARRVVYLDRVDGWKLVPVRIGLTGLRGGVSFSVWPNTSARYELVYRGNVLLSPAHSGVVTVRVIHFY